MEATVNSGSAATDVIGDAFRQHEPWLRRRITFMVGDPEEARDIVQQTFVRAAEHGPWPDGDDGRRWLATVAFRLAVTELRRRKRWGFLPVRDSDATWALDVDPDLWTSIASLDPKVRAVLVLTVLDGYSQEEVASVFNIPRGTISSWLSRARDRLRPILEVPNDARRR